MARDTEEEQYRRCIAEKLPEVTPEDYTACTHKLYKDRMHILSGFMGSMAEKILHELH